MSDQSNQSDQSTEGATDERLVQEQEEQRSKSDEILGEAEGDEAGTAYGPGLGPEPTIARTDVRNASLGIKAEAPEPKDSDLQVSTADSQRQLQAQQPGQQSGTTASANYNSGDHTVDEVVSDVDSGKVSAQDALNSEKAGQNRSTLVSQLESRGAK
jgi:hypothetical protein